MNRFSSAQTTSTFVTVIVSVVEDADIDSVAAHFWREIEKQE